MSRRTLERLADIVEYDRGRVSRAVARHIEEIHDDVKSRPTVGKARSVVLKLEWIPVAREGVGTLAYTEFRCHVDLKIPGKKTATQVMRLTDTGFEFDDMISDDPDQLPLPLENKTGDKTDGAGG